MTENKKVHRYRAFDLQIASQLRFPELKTSVAAPDVTIRYGSVSSAGAGGLYDRCVSANQDEVHLFWEGEGSLLMRGGTEVVIQPAEGAKEDDLRMGILGPGLAAILQQRGHLVLHASGVVIGGKAVAFVGWKGQGKSTTAAALFAQGCPLLTDDLLALNGKDGQRVLAHPGFPQFKLWPDSVQSALAEVPEKLRKVIAGYEKRVRPVIEGFASEPAPLGAIYVLANGSELAMRRLSPQEAFKQIVNNTFCARYGNQVFVGRIAATHLRNVARVVATIPVFGFERPSSLAKVGSLADFVVHHVKNL